MTAQNESIRVWDLSVSELRSLQWHDRRLETGRGCLDAHR